MSYTQITTRYDEVVVPHTSGYLESGPRTINVTIQDLCRRDLAEHLLIPVSNTTVAITLDALKRKGPARLVCRGSGAEGAAERLRAPLLCCTHPAV